jgi:hypothetical protein
MPFTKPSSGGLPEFRQPLPYQPLLQQWWWQLRQEQLPELCCLPWDLQANADTFTLVPLLPAVSFPVASRTANSLCLHIVMIDDI